MGPGESSGSHMMPGGSPGMAPGMASQFMGQQSYGDAVSKGYGHPVMYGRPSAAYNPSAYGGRYRCSLCNPELLVLYCEGVSHFIVLPRNTSCCVFNQPDEVVDGLWTHM